MKITLIQTFNHSVALLTKTGKIGFETIAEARRYAKDKGLEIDIECVHPGGINGNTLPSTDLNKP